MSARLVIAGTQSGVGKTTLTVGLIAALRGRGLSVQPFKVGPDYIDPTYHSLAAGRGCRNLDTWMLPPDAVRASCARAAAQADVAVIEGVMGLYDGADYDGETGSTAEVAKLLQAPVVLVVDAAKMARSAAAVAIGYQRFDADLRLAGFIVNRVAGEGHGRGVSAVITRATGLPVFGWIPREEGLHLPERHLGLVPTTEPGRWQEFIHAAGAMVARNLDIDGLLATGRETPPLPMPMIATHRFIGSRDRPLIAVARDEAFHFLYEDNLDLLRAAGAEIAFFSPLRDTALPPHTAGVLLSGGFPEVFAASLAANRPMHEALQVAHRQALPIYAECGGLMYLTRSIVDGDRNAHDMVGLLPGHSVMSPRLTLGYRLARSAGASWLLPEGETIRGHEFHYSVWQDRPADLPPAYYLQPRAGTGTPQAEGARLGSLWASYVHLNFGACPALAGRFVTEARQKSAGGDA